MRDVTHTNRVNTNRNITAENVLLVLETKNGSQEHTLVSRKQALDAAEAANLDLVQGECEVLALNPQLYPTLLLTLTLTVRVS